jgi:hypothetical protein
VLTPRLQEGPSCPVTICLDFTWTPSAFFSGLPTSSPPPPPPHIPSLRYWGLNSVLARQVLYHLSHTSSTFYFIFHFYTQGQPPTYVFL